MSPEFRYLCGLFAALGLVFMGASYVVTGWLNRRERRRRMRTQRPCQSCQTTASGEGEDWLEQWRRLAGR